MSSNLVREYFYGTKSWTCPAGVKQVRVYAMTNLGAQISGDTIGALSGRFNGSLQNSAAYTMGTNTFQGLGVSGASAFSSPVLVSGGYNWLQVSQGGSFGAAVAADGAAYGWGDVSGSSPISTVVSFPTLVSGGFYWKQICCGNNFVIGLLNSGLAYAYGLNAKGQLGDGTVTNRDTPVINTLSTKIWRNITAGGVGAAGIDENGLAYMWGSNTNGQIGDGTVVAKSTPTLVSGGHSFTQLSTGSTSAGVGSAAGITRDGVAYAWGNNANGQIGDGTVVAKSTPTLVSGGYKWKQISIAGQGTHAVGIVENGDAYAWGLNSAGQLGDSSVVPKSTPTLVAGGQKWAQVCAAGVSSFGITTDGNLYGWGGNGSGQLGQSNQTSVSAPVLVSGGYSWRSVTEALLSSITIPTTPGTAYSVSAVGAASKFGSVPIWSDGVGATNQYLVVEYFT